ncbi:MAG: hypothetical protein CMK09_19295 [Ponticaulis sp.]|nr:hypothetical protein [Ponticaulis sp.]
MLIWSQVDKTPTNRTKTNFYGGRDVTSIVSYYMFEQATKLFGPYAIGWGFDDIEEFFRDGVPIFVNNAEVCKEVNHTAKIKFWYMHPETNQRAEFTSYGHTEYIFNTAHGPKSDSEVTKKSVTDALKKALSMLGFSADVFMSEFSDPNFVKEKKAQEKIAAADEADEKKAEEISKVKEVIDSAIAAFETIQSPAALKAHYNAQLQKIERRLLTIKADKTKVLKPIHDAYNARLDAISPITDVVCNTCGEVTQNRIGTRCSNGGCPGKNEVLKQNDED